MASTVGVTRSRPDSRLESLTALRGFAAGSVFAQHAAFLFVGTGVYESLQHFTQRGGVGVSFFFILSGFVLVWVHRSEDRAGPFYGRRLARIYPNFVASWIIWLLLTAALDLPRSTPAQALANLLLIQAWFPDPGMHYSMSPVSWSLSCEAFFYLCFPLLIGPIVALSRRSRVALLGLLSLLVIAIQVLVQWAPLNPDTTEWLGYVFPPSRLPEFVLGMVLASLLMDGDLPRVRLIPAAVFVAAAFVASTYAPWPAGQVCVTAVPFLVLILAAAQGDMAGTSRLGRSRRLVWFGVVSYAFYLLHDDILRTFVHIVGLRGYSLVFACFLAGALFGLSLLAAAALHHAVEVPAQARLSRILGRRTQRHRA